MSKKSFFMLVEGIDGCGKDTFIKCLANHLSESLSYNIRDLRKSDESEFNDIESKKNILLIAEPTYLKIGKFIRENVVTSNNFSSKAQAESFSIDRYNLLNSYVIPWLKQDNIIISSRSFISSIAYQSISGNADLSLDCILNLAGNELAVKTPPNMVVILETPVEKAIENLKKRTGKRDNAVFEKKEFLEKLSRTYNKNGGGKLLYNRKDYSFEVLLRELFKNQTKLKWVNNDKGLEELDNNAKKLADEIIKEYKV